MKVAVMFSGQGSQYVNMGLEFLKLEKNKEKIDYVSLLLGNNVFNILENEELLNDTINTQVLITLMNILIFDELNINIDGMLGFSLGEYSTLYASGIYDFHSLINLVYKRASYMKEAALNNPGLMAAVLNVPLDELEELINLVNDSNSFVSIVNFNSKNQLVVSGNELGVNTLLEKLKELGKKAVLLNVKGAFHTKLMESASENLKRELNKLNKSNNVIPIYLNVTAKELNINELENMLVRQVKEPVLFYQSIEEMIKDGFTHFIEIGPKKVLTNLVKRNYDVKTFNIETLNDLENIGGVLNG